MLQFACIGVPVVDDTVACHAQQGLIRILLTELILHFDTFWEVRSELNAACGRRIAALLGNLALSLIFQKRRLEEANSSIRVT